MFVISKMTASEAYKMAVSDHVGFSETATLDSKERVLQKLRSVGDGILFVDDISLLGEEIAVAIRDEVLSTPCCPRVICHYDNSIPELISYLKKNREWLFLFS